MRDDLVQAGSDLKLESTVPSDEAREVFVRFLNGQATSPTTIFRPVGVPSDGKGSVSPVCARWSAQCVGGPGNVVGTVRVSAAKL